MGTALLARRVIRQGGQHGIGPVTHLRCGSLDTLAEGLGNLPVIAQRTGDRGMADLEFACDIRQRDTGFGGRRSHGEQFYGRTVHQSRVPHKCA